MRSVLMLLFCLAVLGCAKGHPDANEEGYVFYPDINVVEEMANLMTVQRSYEANISSMDAVKTMYNKALELGRG